MHHTILLVFLTLKTAILANEYCEICKSHTMCLFKANKPPESCVDYKKIYLSLENKTDIVNVHNSLRNFIASGGYVNESDKHFPEAAAMNIMSWNEELATIAQRWADQCRNDEMQDQCRDTEDFPVGQNVITIEIKNKNSLPSFPEIFVSKWSNGFKYFSIQDILEFNKSKTEQIGQGSQLIWDTTEFVGCGIIMFKNPQLDEDSTVQILRIVCNYAPAGNIPNAPIYKAGQPCTMCLSKKCHKDFSNLCTIKDDYFVKKTDTYKSNYDQLKRNSFDWKSKQASLWIL